MIPADPAPPAPSPPRPDGQPPEPRRQVGWVAALGVAGLLGPAVVLVIGYRDCKQGTASGRIVATGAAHGDWRAAIVGCSLAPGPTADLTLDRDDDSPAARIYYEGDLPVVELRTPDQRTLRLDPRRCPLRLDPRRGPTPGTTADLRGGTLHADCALSPSERVTIDVWWQRCRARE